MTHRYVTPYGHFGKNGIMLKFVKEWCKANPGKRVPIYTRKGARIITYHVGSNAFIYSQLKPLPEPTIPIDEFSSNWYKEKFLSTKPTFSEQYEGDWVTPFRKVTKR